MFLYREIANIRVACTKIEGGNIKIKVMNSKGYAYLGLTDIANRKAVAKGDKIPIDHAIWHVYGFSGNGKYGSWGGYDIALVKLATEVPARYTPACLPGIHFQDTSIGSGYNENKRVFTAGFGQYYRKDKNGQLKCQTDEYGPAKHHYCQASGIKGCITDKPPPQSEVCKHFYAQQNTPSTVPFNDMEILLVTKNGTNHCYRNQSMTNKLYGWCKVNQLATKLGKETKLNAESWGFCGKECYLDSNERDSMVQRYVEGVDVLEQNICDEFLNSSLSQTPKVNVN